MASMSPVMRLVLRGGVAGSLAAVPVGAIQIGAWYAGLSGTVPPVQIARSALGALGIPARKRAGRNGVAVVAHLGYGALAGAGYAVGVTSLSPGRSTAVRGAVYGVGLWAFGYLGWVPALNILPPPHRARKAGVAANILAHAVFGVVVDRVLSMNRPPGNA